MRLAAKIGSWFGGGRAPRSPSAPERILEAIVTLARAPQLYGRGRMADDVAGRIEAMTFVAGLAVSAIARAPGGRDLAQDVADAVFAHFDAGLRELGVGDLSVPKKMKRLAGDFYGRLAAYEAAFAADDLDAAAQALMRNALAPEAQAFARPLALALATLRGRLDAAQAAPDAVVAALDPALLML